MSVIVLFYSRVNMNLYTCRGGVVVSSFAYCGSISYRCGRFLRIGFDEVYDLDQNVVVHETWLCIVSGVSDVYFISLVHSCPRHGRVVLFSLCIWTIAVKLCYREQNHSSKYSCS